MPVFHAICTVTARPGKTTLVLGIETSCDETAAAVVSRSADGKGTILSNHVRSQWDEHRAFGGVVPEIAARAHVEVLDRLIGDALAEAVGQLMSRPAGFRKTRTGWRLTKGRA